MLKTKLFCLLGIHTFYRFNCPPNIQYVLTSGTSKCGHIKKQRPLRSLQRLGN